MKQCAACARAHGGTRRKPGKNRFLFVFSGKRCILSLKEPYDFEKAKIVANEMTDMLVLSLTEKHLMTDQMVLHVGYDTVNLATPEQKRAYKGPTKINHYGREVPKSGHGSVNLGKYSASSNLIIES